VKLFQEHSELLDRLWREASHQEDAEVGIPRIAVDAKLLTKDAMEVIKDPQIDIVVELIGGTTIAKTSAWKRWRTGNTWSREQALLGEYGLEIYRAAAEKHVDLGFEASVCGAIPIIRSVKEGLVANRILSIMGIVNGHQLHPDQDDGDGAGLRVGPGEAQAKGYAEADPTLDVGGSTRRTSCRSWPRWPTGLHPLFRYLHRGY